MGNLDRSDDQFDDAKVEKIADIIGLKRKHAGFEAFQTDLRELGQRWRNTIRSAPVDLPSSTHRFAPSKRIRWLENNVEKLAQALRRSLDLKNDPYFSAWGSLDPDGLQFDREPVRRELSALLDYADRLLEDLYKQKNEKAPQTAEKRYEMVWDIVQCFKHHAPDKTLSVGTYDGESHTWKGYLPEFVLAVFSEIVGGAPPSGQGLDNLLRLALKD
jgi:hypothetical protein